MNLNIKKIIVTFSLLVLIVPAVHAMSLALKKEKVKSEKKIAEYSQEIKKDCGCIPTIEVNWESFTVKDDFTIPKHMMSSVVDGMNRVCKEFKKEVCDGLKTIKISKKTPMEKFLKDGVLDLSSEGSNRSWPGQAIQDLIEKNL
jgi:hypothetical protein